MSVNRIGALFVGAAALVGCWHATVETGLPVGTQTVSQPWASVWLWGLVPPKTVAASNECTSGVAKVETQLSFLNSLVHILTLGIYTPMEIKVTCAASSSSMLPADAPALSIPAGASSDVIQARFSEAANKAVETGEAVLIQFEH
jgi:hypothetical protein